MGKFKHCRLHDNEELLKYTLRSGNNTVVIFKKKKALAQQCKEMNYGYIHYNMKESQNNYAEKKWHKIGTYYIHFHLHKVIENANHGHRKQISGCLGT